MIGDPGGKTEERTLLEDDQIKANLEGIRPQMERFLDFSPAPADTQALLVDNGDWLRQVGFLEFLRDVGKHFTVNQMVTKESVRSRIERPEHGISFTEFCYMLLQAYDYLQLFDAYDCRLQLGGSDQWGNITTGIELIRKVRRAEAFGLTSPLVVQPDGTKFGKTESGTIWLDSKRTSPYQLFQFFLRVEDSVVCDYLRMLTFLDHDTIRLSTPTPIEHPSRAQSPEGTRPRGVHARPRRGRDRPRREGWSGTVLRGDSRSRRADPARGVRRSARPPRWRARRSMPGLNVVNTFVDVGLCRLARSGPHRDSARGRLREQQASRVPRRRVEPRRPAPRTATWSCGKVDGTTISCDSTEAATDESRRRNRQTTRR